MILRPHLLIKMLLVHCHAASSDGASSTAPEAAPLATPSAQAAASSTVAPLPLSSAARSATSGESTSPVSSAAPPLVEAVSLLSRKIAQLGGSLGVAIMD